MHKVTHERLARCLNLLAEHEFVILYRQGKMNGSGDGLYKLAIEVEVYTENDEGHLLLSVMGPSEEVRGVYLEAHLTMAHKYLSIFNAHHRNSV